MGRRWLRVSDGGERVKGVRARVNTSFMEAGLGSVLTVGSKLIKRANVELLEYFPSADHSDYEILRDLVGIRPLRVGGV